MREGRIICTDYAKCTGGSDCDVKEYVGRRPDVIQFVKGGLSDNRNRLPGVQAAERCGHDHPVHR